MIKDIHTKLAHKAAQLKQTHLTELFACDGERGERFSVATEDLWLNYSRNHLDEETVGLLLELAEKSALSEKISCLYSGDKINQSEARSALHILLRAPLDKDNPNSVLVHRQLQLMQQFADEVAANKVIADTQISDVVCIGIGGSELGVKVLYQALDISLKAKVRLHFVANIDGAAVDSVMRRINKKSSLFLITSKSFMTFETLKNYTTLKQWFSQGSDNLSEQEFMQRCYAITACPDSAKKLGFDSSHIFEFWDWVGGRFSIWSSVGLPIVLAYGMDVFKDLLAGAHRLDQHFINAPFAENLPVLLGMIHIWHSNFMHYTSRAIIPYAQKLEKLPSYLQQLEMESLGKSVDVEGKKLDYPTSPIIWGSAGSNGQHAFFQLLHQGSQIVPVDFIAALESGHDFTEHHNALLANCLAQSQSLMTGGDINKKEHGKFEGNRPSNFILIKQLSPACLGELLALYEHKVFVQSVVWNINAFDQWGVELGKKIAHDILAKTDNEKIDITDIKATFKLPPT